jgi:hypothetical protein
MMQSFEFLKATSFLLWVCACHQGDQIVRILAYFVIAFFGQFFENYRKNPSFWATFSAEKVAYKFGHETGWATLWVSVSQTHLVTPPAIKAWRVGRESLDCRNLRKQKITKNG